MRRSLTSDGSSIAALLLCAALGWASAAAAEPVPAETGEVAEAAEAEDDAALERLLLEEDPLFDEPLPSDSASRDPWESCNRRTFAFNRGLDTFFFDPVTEVYRFAMPRPGRRAVERAVLNFDTPAVLANQLLQLRLTDSAATFGRFLINSSFGVGGLFDPAGDSMGIERSDADFGQTMALYGVPGGPYVILPVFGPATARDAVGTVVDQAVDPLTYLLGPLSWWRLLIGGGEGLVLRDAALDEFQTLEEGSVDFYSALRSAYLQSRDAMVAEARTDVVRLR